jgi:hypothetical protein
MTGFKLFTLISAGYCHLGNFNLIFAQNRDFGRAKTDL